ncbi:YwqH-like family protein [Shouchella lonarensis]|uniref:Uncharacterized protein n=1 Tax=Shouchella lonarensis TaxID=1464122 RepID=A0A1G6HZE2_9BACI|nr:DUF5082 family protein [Shouchella lonarensis]SDB99642.1 protein of unknown function [Shouchella lonarensis]
MYQGRINMRQSQLRNYRNERSRLERAEERLQKAKTQLEASQSVFNDHNSLIRDPQILWEVWKGKEARKQTTDYRSQLGKNHALGGRRIERAIEAVQDALSRAQQGIREYNGAIAWAERDLNTLRKKQRNWLTASQQD